ncbi:MAG: hypothetical protein V3V35_01805, partial [Dehalococcoidia bacterium]
MERDAVDLPRLHDLLEKALEDPRITIRRKLDPPQMAVEDRWRVFFSTQCQCGISALLFLDISKDKTAAEVREAVPGMLKVLSTQTDQFLRMPCELHR